MSKRVFGRWSLVVGKSYTPVIPSEEDRPGLPGRSSQSRNLLFQYFNYELHCRALLDRTGGNARPYMVICD